VSSLGSDDRSRAISALTLAFVSDPVIRWVLSDSDDYLQTWPPFVEAFAGEAFEHGTAYAIEDCSAVAMWLPPGAESDGEAMQRLMSEGSDPLVGDDLDGVFEQMDMFHPSFEHWYLPLIGVDPVAQARGLGTALMRHVLADLDNAGISAYLETTSPRNRSMYERHRFEAVGVIQHGGSPPMGPMVSHRVDFGVALRWRRR
jgi:GNAT superfamily N-acetyltransferase